MANKGTKKSQETKKVAASTAKVTKTSVAVAPSAILSAKDKAEAARKKLMAIKAKIRKALNLKKKYDERKAKKETAIIRAKAGTSKSAEELEASVIQFEKDAAALLKENKALLSDGDLMQGRLDVMDQELKEIRAANKKNRKTGTKTGGGSVAAAKAALVKALSRRVFIVRYDDAGEAALTATKTADKVTVDIKFLDESWETKVDGKVATHNYGQGAIQIADGFFPKVEKEKAKKAA
jgi:DNA repair exonuclease SbcCD ATPase subunit